MRISHSDSYACHDCKFEYECRKLYCQKHRLLYRECESAVLGIMGDFDVVHGTAETYEDSGQCPDCVQAYAIQAFDQTRAKWGLSKVDRESWKRIG